jgi:hypothetical protein
MNKTPQFVMMILITSCFLMHPVSAGSGFDAQSCDDEVAWTGYALVMANGTALKISEYEIDLDRETVFFKSLLSGLNATFPLERIARVVSYDARLSEVPEDAQPLFIPENSVADSEDDGGIPVLFKVTKTIVGSGNAAGSSGYSRAGGAQSGDNRQSYTPSRTSGYSSSSSSSRTGSSMSSASSSRPSSPSTTPSSSSSSAADNFFNALFGGR